MERRTWSPQILKIASLLGLTLVLAPEARAGLGFHLETTAFPTYSQTNTAALGEGFFGGNFDGSSELKPEAGFSYELRNTFGLLPLPWLMVGVTYNYANSPAKREATANYGSLEYSLKTNEWGPSLGIFLGNVRLIGSVFVSGNKKRTEKSELQDGTLQSDQTAEAKLSTGFQVTLGYSFSISPVFRIGPSLSYRKATYKTVTYTNNLMPELNVTDSNYAYRASESSLVPMVSLMFDF